MGLIHDKAKAGDLKGIKDLIAEEAESNPSSNGNPVEDRDLHENTVLHAACKN
ncbi:hypothetical protein HKX48_007675, partial [Thoreauomyces humboldtii]